MTRRSDFDRRQAVARLYDEACAAIDKERWQEAVEKLDRVRDIDLDFPGAEYRQRLAHKWHRIAKLHEMGQRHMREGGWHEALSCFRQIRRDAENYKDVALLQRYCERQLIPAPPPDNRRQMLIAGTALATGVMFAMFGLQFTESLPPGSIPSVSSVISNVTSQLPNPLLGFATPSETPGVDTATPAGVQSSEPTDDPADASAPDETAAPLLPGSTRVPRPAARPRPTRTPTRVFLAAATSTRQPATTTPTFAPAGSTATPTIAGIAQTATPSPSDTATPAASVDPTPTTQSGVLNLTETPTATPADTATSAATVPAATATSIPTQPTASATATPTQPANTATATATLPANTATAAPTVPAATPTNTPTTIPPTPVQPTPTDSPSPLPPTPTFTRMPTPVPPTPTRTATPVPAPSTQFITAREFSFEPNGGFVSSGARVRINLSNQGTVTHAWVLKDSNGNTLARVSAAPGQLAPLDFTAPAPGVYNFVCDISDHAQQGMKGLLTVR